jgi:hypothetical protein
MHLTNFISGLINEGQVSVAPAIAVFTEADLQKAKVHLQQYYHDDCLEMPGAAPAYNEAAAIWGAMYIYRTVQFILLRNLDEHAIQEAMPTPPAERTPDVIYSADLTLRYFPNLFHHARGISPGDPLVKHLQQTATEWPFSAAMTDLPIAGSLEYIWQHTSLQKAYIDRIIRGKDIRKALHPACLPFIQEALGAHISTLWPQLARELAIAE